MRPYILVAVILLLTAPGRSQPAADSAWIKRVKAAYPLANSDPASALSIADSGLQHARLTGDERLEAYAGKTKGWALYHIGNFDSCFPAMQKATRLFQQFHDTVEIMYMYTNLAIAYSNHSQFDLSAAYAMKADSLARIKNDPKVVAAVKRQMGILYRQQGDYKKAIAYFNESLALYKSAKDTMKIYDVISSLSITYNHYLHAPDSSLALLKKYAPMIDSAKGYNYGKSSLHEQFGDTYFALADYPRALDNYKTAYAMFASQEEKADMYYEAIDVGKTYGELKNYNEGEKFLLQAYKGNDSLKMTNYAYDAANELTALYKKEGDWQKALRWSETKFSLYDSLQIVEQKKKVAEFETKYETEKKDAEITVLKKDQELNRLTLQKQKTFRYGAIALLILLTLIASLVINRTRIVQKAKRLVEMERLRNNIARDLHDDMGSSLSSINVFSKVALENGAEKENTREYLKKIRDNSRTMMESMSDIVWAINPVNDNFESVIYKMKEFAADMLDPLNINYEFIQKGDPTSVDMGLDKRKDLYLIFKEAINNIAKYSGCTKAVVTIILQKDEITLSIMDDGRGFDPGIGSTGNGLRNMKRRAEEMMGNATIVSEKGKGTTVALTIAPAAR